MGMDLVLVAWFFPFWLTGQPCPDWSLAYASRAQCEEAAAVAERRGYEVERCELLSITDETVAADAEGWLSASR